MTAQKERELRKAQMAAAAAIEAGLPVEMVDYSLRGHHEPKLTCESSKRSTICGCTILG